MAVIQQATFVKCFYSGLKDADVLLHEIEKAGKAGKLDLAAETQPQLDESFENLRSAFEQAGWV